MLNKYLSENPKANVAFQLLIAVISSLFFGFTMKFFLIPGNIFSAGVPGLAQIINYFFKDGPLQNILTIGNLYFIFNIPLLILSYYKLGRDFTILTIIVVFLSSQTTNLFPVTYVSRNPLVNAIMGGVFSGLGAGITIKYGMSGGGFDILSIYLARQFGMNVGPVSFIANLIIVIGSGIIYSWEAAIFTIIAIFVTSRMIDTIHTGEQRLTAFIVTNEAASVTANIRTRLIRGTTIIDARGGYTGDKRDLLMVVVNRYELHDLQLAILEADSKAFINIIHSTKVMGQFLNREQQTVLRKQTLQH